MKHLIIFLIFSAYIINHESLWTEEFQSNISSLMNGDHVYEEQTQFTSSGIAQNGIVTGTATSTICTDGQCNSFTAEQPLVWEEPVSAFRKRILSRNDSSMD